MRRPARRPRAARARRRRPRPSTGSRAPRSSRSTRRRPAAPWPPGPRASVPSEPTRNRSTLPAVLGQQVLERVAAHLTAEPAELGAHVREVLVHQGAQLRLDAGRTRAPGDVQRHHVVDRAAVAERPRPAGVVADHPADRAAGVRRRVRPEAQAVRSGGPLQVGVHDAGLDDRRTCLGVDRDDPVEVLDGVDDDAGADRVAGDRGAGAAHGDRYAGGPRDVEDRVQLVGVRAAARPPAGPRGRARRPRSRAPGPGPSRRRR